MEFIPKHPILNFLPDTLETIRKMYDLENGRITQSVDILEQWIKKQRHFVNTNFNRAYLEFTIIACKGSVEKAKKQFDRLCTFKTLLPKYFIDGDVKNRFSRLNEFVFIFPMPNMTKEYLRVYYVKIVGEVTSEHLLEYFRIVIAIAEYLKQHDYVNGFITVFDFREANLLDLMMKLNLVDCQQFTSLMIEGLGLRVSGIHVISQSKVVDMFVKLVKSMLSEKLGKRIQAHRDLESLNQVFDKELLPAELGGNERPMKEIQEAWIEVLSSAENEKFFARMKESKTDETLRLTSQFNDQYVGLPGSFRTLTVD